MSSAGVSGPTSTLRVIREDATAKNLNDPFAINLRFAKTAGWTWLHTVLISLCVTYFCRLQTNWSSVTASLAVAPLLLCILPLVSRLKYKEDILRKIAIRSSFLGAVFAINLPIACESECSFWNFSLYFASLSFFHFSEFFVYSLANPRQCTIESFMLNHSTAYNIAAVTSWVEYWLRFLAAYYFSDDRKPASTFGFLSLSELNNGTTLQLIGLGFACVVFGEVFRKTAMLTARISFSHYVEFRKRDEHVLVTSGVYRLIRHPSYTGWLIWCVGTQMVLANPLCIVAYAVVAVRFFHDRIADEEWYLIEFFGREYIEYQKKTVSGIPFVKAVQPTSEQSQRLQLDGDRKRD